MRTIIICLTTIVCFMLFPGYTSGKKVEVRLKVNEELIYEWTEKEVHPDKMAWIPDKFKTTRYSLFIDKIENNKVFFTIQTLWYRSENKRYGISEFEDPGFPQLANYFWLNPPDHLVDESLHQKKIRYELDLNTRTIRLTNLVEILAQCESNMVAKGYDDKTRLRIINNIKMGYQKPPFLYPFMFLDSDIDQTTIHQQKLGITFTTLNRKGDQLELISTPDSLGNNSRGTLNLEYGLVTSFSRNSIITAKDYKTGYMPNSKVQISELYTLLQKSFRKPPQVIICGHIENPVSNQVIVHTLNKFFGNDLDSKMGYLDEAGNFRIEAKLENKGLVIVINPNKKQNIPGPVILLYAEPGDSLHLNTRLTLKQIQEKIIDAPDPFPINRKYMITEQISFSGDRKEEAELLYKFHEQSGLNSFKILNNKLQYYRGIDDVKTYLNALNKLEQMMNSSRKSLSSQSAQYLEHELQAFLYAQLIEAPPAEWEIMWPWISNLPANPKDRKDLVQSQLDTLNINRIYNDYGLFSRNLTTQYWRYKYNQLIPLSRRVKSSNEFNQVNDVEQNLQFNKLILSGSPLYREMASQLYGYSFGTNNVYAGIFRNYLQWQRTIDETFELMIKRCNDEVFINALKELRNTQLSWNDLSYIPGTVFLNLQRKPATLRPFIAEKPTIIYATNNWSVPRYEMDDLASENPGINFVLINGGTNYDLWKEWNDRAAPVAHQLFMINDSVRLQDVFLDKINSYLVYNRSGERIGIERDLKKAILLAKQSLEPKKKEISKSTLTGIIQLLSLLLFLFFVVFIIYKYRMRSRMKKQEQEKRLRELQMAAIRAQMNPHFLFNSLNSVQNLIQQNKNEEAHLYLSDFAGLIRKVLRNSDKEEVSLAEELEMVEQYLKLEKLRFDFNFEVNVEDGIDPHNTMVPSILLQPFAENAVIHGLQHKLLNRQLKIDITRKKPGICISIEDNGIGREASQKIAVGNNGKSTNMIKERLAMLQEKQGEKYQFEITDLDEGPEKGTRVEILIPDEV